MSEVVEVYIVVKVYTVSLIDFLVYLMQKANDRK